MANELKEEGNQCFKEKRYNKAVLLYTSSLEREVDPTVLGNRAQCYINLNRFYHALMDCNRALELNPGYIKGLFRRAVALESMGLITAAKKDIQRLLTLSEDNAANTILERLKKKHDIPCLEVSICEKGDEIRSTEALQSIKIDFDQMDVAENVDCTPSAVDNDVYDMQDLRLFRPPVSYSDMMVDFSLLRKNPKAFAEYFMKIVPDSYQRLFDDVLDVEVISCLLEGISHSIGGKPSNIEPKAVCRALLHLSGVRRFDMIILFLSAEDKKNLQVICDNLLDVDAQLVSIKYFI